MNTCEICKNGCFAGLCTCPCHHPEEKREEWRRNLIKTIKRVIYQDKCEVAQVIIDCLDAAYLQGLEDKQARLTQITQEIEGEKINKALPNYWADGVNDGLDKALEIIKKYL